MWSCVFMCVCVCQFKYFYFWFCVNVFFRYVRNFFVTFVSSFWRNWIVSRDECYLKCVTMIHIPYDDLDTSSINKSFIQENSFRYRKLGEKEEEEEEEYYDEENKSKYICRWKSSTYSRIDHCHFHQMLRLLHTYTNTPHMNMSCIQEHGHGFHTNIYSISTTYFNAVHDNHQMYGLSFAQCSRFNVQYICMSKWWTQQNSAPAGQAQKQKAK